MPDNKFESQGRGQTVETTLGLLDAVETGEGQSQRGLAARLGVALGLTNAVVKRCIKKGLLKVRDAPARRYAYYLTPKGFQEKSRLTAEYLTVSLSFFRRARTEYADALAYCEHRGWKRVALYGAGELAEIASLAADGANVDLVAVIDPERNAAEFCGLPVAKEIESAGDLLPFDAVIVTSAKEPQRAFDIVVRTISPERVLTPALLHVARDRTLAAEDDAS